MISKMPESATLRLLVRCSDCKHCRYDEERGEYGSIFYQGFDCVSPRDDASSKDGELPWNGVNRPRVCPAFEQRRCKSCGAPIRLDPNDESWMDDRWQRAEHCEECLNKFYDGLESYFAERAKQEAKRNI